MENSYSQFLMCNLAIEHGVIDRNEGYDVIWGESGELLTEFEGSRFDEDSDSEYNCITKFLIIKKKKLENKQRLYSKQVYLQKQMQKDGYNIVTCGNCGALNIHTTNNEDFHENNIDCYGCGTTISKSDCSDYFY